ncbi:MAG: UDP-N-acetylglucosamine 1-carboxyvinyltransferase [Candidatus Tectomicrobia bacterium]|uniref:UDP-N-acetylglucosamine 1-carboxyvinyltransferase n=1 Tax=Tectimicrobiota bacterium TaxID=2528274 RepID=A0A932LZX0_UNCTE|nr:UDP-N-acetylglucosamine 1-carboxyvinyltransferase [Candidatus Tectomicrobia bacterium]
MDSIVIHGGLPLRGKVAVSGAKNAALPILAATLLASGRHLIHNVPAVQDVKTISKLLTTLGARVTELGGGDVEVDTTGVERFQAPYELVKTMRASVLVLGPLLGRLGKARVSLPGGCAIGARPIDQHLKGLQALGARVELKGGDVSVSGRKLKGTHVYLDMPTVTGTANIMMAAVLAEGETVIDNAACEPEVETLAAALNAMGAGIKGAGTDRIEITGVRTLHGSEFTVIPDRIEAGTLLVAGAISGGEVHVTRCVPENLKAVTAKLREAGLPVEEGDREMRVTGSRPLRAVDIKTAPHPGFATDMQAQLMALMSVSEGVSVITETVFENRFMHVAELKRMGADISVVGNTARVKGVARLSGAPVMATDLRASASLVLAGLVAEGETTVSRVYHLDRGYEGLEKKLAALGARIWRLK